jgi:hypothetical protein
MFIDSRSGDSLVPLGQNGIFFDCHPFGSVHDYFLGQKSFFPPPQNSSEELSLTDPVFINFLIFIFFY